MKKKSSLYFYFIFMNYFYCIAQTYTPFPTSDAIWTSRHFYLSNDIPKNIEYQILMDGVDTIINEIKYKKITKRGNIEDIIALREVDKKIYIRMKVFGVYTDTLLYDFNLKLGDTLRSKAHSNLQSHIVSKVDSILINGRYRKRFGLTFRVFSPNSNISLNDYLIEGIGCACGFIPYPFLLESSGRLLCHSIGNQQLFGNETGQCLILSNNHPIINDITVKISPNPVQDLAQIEIPENVEIDKMIVYDYLGRLVHIQNINCRLISIHTKDYNKGLYFIQFYHKNALKGASKFIVQ